MLAKYLLPLVAIISFGGGSLFGTKLLAPKPEKIEIPACPQCPLVVCPPAVSLQSFDLSKLNNKKGNFTYAPSLHDVTIKIEAKDSTLIKQILRSAK